MRVLLNWLVDWGEVVLILSLVIFNNTLNGKKQLFLNKNGSYTHNPQVVVDNLL